MISISIILRQSRHKCRLRSAKMLIHYSAALKDFPVIIHSWAFETSKYPALFRLISSVTQERDWKSPCWFFGFVWCGINLVGKHIILAFQRIHALLTSWQRWISDQSYLSMVSLREEMSAFTQDDKILGSLLCRSVLWFWNSAWDWPPTLNSNMIMIRASQRREGGFLDLRNITYLEI